MGDGLKYGTVNSDDDDVGQVAAALADACLAGGLSDGYYRVADEALKRIAVRLPSGDNDRQPELDRLPDTAVTEIARGLFCNRGMRWDMFRDLALKMATRIRWELAGGKNEK